MCVKEDHGWKQQWRKQCLSCSITKSAEKEKHAVAADKSDFFRDYEAFTASKAHQMQLEWQLISVQNVSERK